MPGESPMHANVWKYYVYLFFLNFQLWWPIWIIYLTEKRGFTLGEVALLDVPFWVSIILLQIPAAAIADRWGRKPTLLASAAAFAGAVSFFGLANSFWLILGSYVVWGISFALLSGTESAFIYDSLKAVGRQTEYPKIYGRGWAVATAGGLAGTLLGAPLADATSLPFPIVLSGGLAFFAVLVAFAFNEPMVRDHDAPYPSYGRIISESFAIVRDKPAVRYGILYFGLITVGSIGPIFFFQKFLLEHHVGLWEVGLWQTPMRVAAVVGALLAHRLISGFGEKRTFYVMAISLVAAYGLLATWDSVYAQLAFPVLNVSVVLSQPGVTNFLNKLVETEQRATVLSLTSLVRSMILIPSAPLLGALADQSLGAAFGAGAIIVAVLGLPLLVLWTPYLDQAEVEVAAVSEQVATVE
ncbi:MAG TPA: MFS transporter [Dehalococcoidia bacterium]|nr:MFS transporter [Dehalococcoidia bacterium]